MVNVEVINQESEVREEFPDEKLFMVKLEWFSDFGNHKAFELIPEDLTWDQKRKFLADEKFYVWDEPYLFRLGNDNLLRRCVSLEESKSILWHCHNSLYEGHFNGLYTARKSFNRAFIGRLCLKMLTYM